MNIGSITTQDFRDLGLSGSYAKGEAYALQGEIAKTDSFTEALERAQSGENPEELMKACKEFETYFINEMFKAMRKTVQRSDDSLIPKSMAEDYFQENLDDEYSKRMTEAGGVGLAKFLYAQLSSQYTARPVSPFAEERNGVIAASVNVETDEGAGEP